MIETRVPGPMSSTELPAILISSVLAGAMNMPIRNIVVMFENFVVRFVSGR